MADSFTANYNWVKPEVGAAQDSWGATLNEDLNQIDAQVFSISTTLNGYLVTNSTVGSYLLLNKPASGKAAYIQGGTNGLTRWQVILGDASTESGADAGSNFSIERFFDSGAAIDAPLTINRATGVVSVNQQPVNANDVATKTYVDNLVGRAPVGSVVDFAGATPPAGWLMCDGTVYAISAYPGLHTVLGNTYGGNGTTTFAVPNLNGRVTVAAAGFAALGAVGGEYSHTLAVNEMPSHTHTDAGHAHFIQPTGYEAQGGGTGAAAGAGVQFVTPPNTTSSASANIQATGGGAAHNNLQPYMALYKIIRAI